VKVAVRDTDIERVSLQRAQGAVEAVRQNLSGLEMLSRIGARLEEEIRDACAAIETVSQLRAELRGKNLEDFQRAENFTEVAARI
jgi:hypothetical protein